MKRTIKGGRCIQRLNDIKERQLKSRVCEAEVFSNSDIDREVLTMPGEQEWEQRMDRSYLDGKKSVWMVRVVS